MENHYPKSPAGVPKEITQPSAGFRNGVRKITFALLLFAIIYLLLLAAGMGAAFCLAILGGYIIITIHHFIGIVAGAGLILTGGMVLYFLVKFLFETKKDQRSSNLEITEAEYPELFDFIRRLSMDTQTDFPKHIYISPDVNAAVFYDSNFRSMFFPVKKNLLIGLGLVNSLNISEFKAVIAHEFGHFSQKSMRAGSYVYQVNKVMYNMLYENEGYGRLLSKWAGIHYIFALCANFTVKLVEMIQWVQRQAYKMVNRQYYGLSQQMEYHADAIAAATSGSNNAISALRRIDFGDDCYGIVIKKYNEWLNENLKGDNLYEHQRIVAARMADEYRLSLQNGLPVLSGTNPHYKSYGRVSIDNQWASHPTLQQREDALNKINVTGEVIDEPAWVLFGDRKALQEKLTGDLYETVKFKGPPQVAGSQLFSEKYYGEREDYSYPLIYDFFYNGRQISAFDPEKARNTEQIKYVKEFFEANAIINNKAAALDSDIELLGNIVSNPSAVRSFNFDGVKYKSNQAEIIKTNLENEQKQLRETLQAKDEAVYAWCISRTEDPEAKKTLNVYYGFYFRLRELCNENISTCINLSMLLQQLQDKQNPKRKKTEEDVVEMVKTMQSRIKIMAEFLSEPEIPFKFILTDKLVGVVNSTFASLGKYGLSATNLDVITANMNEFISWSIDTGFKCQKELLEYQEQYL